jgi:hypothetical protein
MTSFFHHIIDDVLFIVLVHLDHQELEILGKTLKLYLDYESLFQVKFPDFYQMIKQYQIKSKSEENFPNINWSQLYNECSDQEAYDGYELTLNEDPYLHFYMDIFDGVSNIINRANINRKYPQLSKFLTGFPQDVFKYYEINFPFKELYERHKSSYFYKVIFEDVDRLDLKSIIESETIMKFDIGSNIYYWYLIILIKYSVKTRPVYSDIIIYILGQTLMFQNNVHSRTNTYVLKVINEINIL